MNQGKKLLMAALVSATLLSACNASANLNVPGAGQIGSALSSFISELQANGTARDTVVSTSGDATVQSQAATDLQPYRCQFNQSSKTWDVYYYSPSKNKSYLCHKNADKTVNVTVVNDQTLVYQAGDTIDITQVNVDASAACQTAAQAVASASPAPTSQPTTTPTTAPTASPTAAPAAGGSSSTTTINNVTINNVILVSANQYNMMTGGHSSHPVWVCNANNQNVYVDANSGNTISVGGSTVINPVPAASTTTVLPSPAPTTMPTTVASPAATTSTSTSTSTSTTTTASPTTTPTTTH